MEPRLSASKLETCSSSLETSVVDDIIVDARNSESDRIQAVPFGLGTAHVP